MGNQLIKNYDIQKESSGVGGFHSLWKIYPGNRQDRTVSGPNMVSIFMLDKKFLEKTNKTLKEDLNTFLRKEASLARFKHPNCLSMIEPLVEDNKNMAFVTENVQSSLQNYINTNNLNEFYSTDFEVKMHLLELLQALSFFHNDVKSAHLGVSPENIYVTANGKWKLGGTVFTTQLLSDKLGNSSNIDFSAKFDNLISMNPNLNFSAPEVCDHSSKCSFTSDVFSLGLLIYSLFKAKADQNTNSIYCINAHNLAMYKDKITSLNQNLHNQKFIKDMPQTLKILLTRMLQIEPSLRPSVSDILGSAWFNDPFIQTIAHLETLAQKDVNQQILFLKGVSKILLKFEAKVIKTIILPNLIDYLKVEQLSPIIIQIIISILDQNTIMNKNEFNEIIWPSIKALTTGKEIPAQALYLLVSNLKILCEFISNIDLQNFLMPLILKCYECGVSKLQELALQNTEFLVKKLDFVFIKTKILPRILKLCTDSNNDLRRNALFCLNKIYHLFERVTIIDQVIGTLEKIKKMGADAKMNIIILSIYEGISKTIGIEVIATKILPNLVCNLSDLNLSKSEFKSYLTTIQALIKKIEEERLADPSGTLKEDDSDMNKVLKEIEDMDKDQTKKNNEIFSVMQGPSTNNEFDFLNIFETSPVVVQKNDSSLATNNTTQISNNDNLQQNTTTNIGTGNKNPIFIPEISTQKTNLGQKIDSNFDFLSEIDGSNKPFHTSLKPKSQNQGLFNQTVQMKKMQAPPTNINFNNNLNENNYNVSNNDKNQNNAQNLFNNLNLNPKSNMISYGNQQQPIINNSTTLKGNMLNLNYDPFSEIDIKRHSFDQNPNNSNKIVNNVFSGEPIDLSSDFKKTQTNNKPTLSQNSKKNENDSGWNFDDFQNLNINSGVTNLGAQNMKNIQPQIQENFNSYVTSQGFSNKQKQNLNMGMNFGNSATPFKKPSDNLDFFQNAVPVDKGLKINKLNSNFKNDDLI